MYMYVVHLLNKVTLVASASLLHACDFRVLGDDAGNRLFFLEGLPAT